MIIQSLLENDLYSFTQQQAILNHFPDVDVEYEFKCRNNVDLRPYAARINEEISLLCTLRFTHKELDYLRTLPFLRGSYIDFLKTFQLQRDHIKVYEKDGELKITIKGNWFHTILFEVPVLAIVSEVVCGDLPASEGPQRLRDKIKLVRDYQGAEGFQFADFGLRRRYSRQWHDEVVRTLVKVLPDQFIGTSNVYLAMKYGLRPIGTMSHQWVMCGQGLNNVRVSYSQKYMLEMWVTEFRGELGIALSDTLGFDAFLRDFDLYLAKIYDGCRQDSGDPFEWCEKLIAHYRKLGIDPKTKTAIFSDGLNFPLAFYIHSRFYGQIKMSFGIGTHLTNDCGVTPLQNVIKLVSVNGNPVAKISDSFGKGMCQDKGYLDYLKRVFNIK